jgi:two-component system, OmpR family, sensor histidine kinase TctE
LNVGNILQTVNSHNKKKSLKNQLFRWLLLLLLPLMLVSAIIGYYYAQQFINIAYDKSLYRIALSLADQLNVENNEIQVNLPEIAKNLVEFDEDDDVYFRMIGPKGDLIASHTNLPLPTTFPGANQHFYYQAKLKKDALRAIVFALPLDTEFTQPIYVMVGETLQKRSRIAEEMLLSMLLPQLLIGLLVSGLIFIGVKRGLAPLDQLKTDLSKRDMNDLSPINNAAAPAELQPLLRAFNDMLAKVSNNIGRQQRFIADASHQLKTPLAGLKTQAELAIREKDPAKISHALGQINQASGNLSHLVSQLLALTKAEPDNGEFLAFETLDLCELAQTTTADWVTKALQNNIDLGYESSLKTAPILGNAVLLRELINNLIDNAILYTPAGGSITTGVKLSDENQAGVNQASKQTIFYVQDNGSGISIAHQSKIFERFYRVLGTQKEGSGLGLTIVQEIANRHQANVQVVSDGEGKGTLFLVIFDTI